MIPEDGVQRPGHLLRSRHRIADETCGNRTIVELRRLRQWPQVRDVSARLQGVGACFGNEVFEWRESMSILPGTIPSCRITRVANATSKSVGLPNVIPR